MANPNPPTPLDEKTESLTADLEGGAIDNANACPVCTHPPCERRRIRLREARSDLRARIAELVTEAEHNGVRAMASVVIEMAP